MSELFSATPTRIFALAYLGADWDMMWIRSDFDDGFELIFLMLRCSQMVH